MWNEFVDWLESNLASCVYVKYFGIECPGCGLQRSFIALLRGDFLLSFSLYPALIPMMSLIIHFK